MKSKMNFRIGLVLLPLCICISCSRDKPQNLPQDDTISFYSTPELYELTKEWAGVYNKLNPDVEINVVNASASSVTANLDDSRNMSFVSGDLDSVIYARTLWKVVVGRDVIVPVIHSENPLASEICQKGISSAGFSQLIQNPGTTDWGTLLKTGHQAPVNLYITDKAASHSGWSEFLDAEQVKINGIHLADKQELLAAVQGDKYAIVICNLTDVIGTHTHKLLEEVKLLPIDKNGNGIIDYKEDIYADLNTFSRGVWIGKYPRELSSNIYSVSAAIPSNESEMAFLKWTITSGQVLLDNHGFSKLVNTERAAQVKWIDSFIVGGPGSGNYIIPKEPGFFSRPVPMILAVTLVLALLSISLLRYLSKRRGAVQDHIHIPKLAFNETVIKILPGLYYDKSHTWAFMDKDGLVKVGMDDFLQHVTGPLTRIKMKLPGERIRKGKHAISIIQNGKQLDIGAPVSGIIKEQNSRFSSNASAMNSAEGTAGWVYKIEPTNWLKEVQFLLMGKRYREWLKTEFQRLKEFLSESIRPGAVEYAHVLQDGGELKDCILEDLGPEAWEDFQTNFIDIN